MNYDKLRDIFSTKMNEPTIDNPYGKSIIENHGANGIEKLGFIYSPPSFTSFDEVEELQKDEFIKTIIATRQKLIDFMDKSNLLLKILDPQSIRETIKELRWEIRTMKMNHDISEIDIIEYLEKQHKQEEQEDNFEDELPF